jgi:RNA polymerase sigma factor (sigma-70 family)
MARSESLIEQLYRERYVGFRNILNEEKDPALAEAVRSLPPKRRLVLFLRYYADFTYGEIAEALEIAEGTVGASLAQAHAALLDELMKQEVAQ